MKNYALELVFILDESGSMYNLTSDTIGGFNSMLDKQKAKYENVLLTTVFFNDDSKIVHDRIPISEAAHLTGEDYTPCGCTALLDAIGKTIAHISHIHKYIRQEDVPEKTLFVITTDGQENVSYQYTFPEIRKMIEEKKSVFGWDFSFLGANIDAFAVADDLGVDLLKTRSFVASSPGVAHMFCDCMELVDQEMIDEDELPF